MLTRSLPAVSGAIVLYRKPSEDKPMTRRNGVMTRATAHEM